MSLHVRDRLRFFAQWLRNPRQVAAVTPSGSELVAAILDELPEGTRRVIELGGGTGAITRALLASGIPEVELLVVALNASLQAQLQAQFPRARVVLGDAADLPQLARDSGYADGGPSVPGFVPVAAELEDIYFAAIAGYLRDRAEAVA